MYVYTDGLAASRTATTTTRIYWCLKTMKSFGPDDDMVSGELCRNGSRTCYEPI